MIETLIQLHSRLFFWLYSFSSGSDELRFWLYFIAEYVDIYIVLLGIIFIVTHRHVPLGNRPEIISWQSLKEGLFIFWTINVAWGISYVMKIIFAAPRPFLRFAQDVAPLFPYGGFDSFPSGHATLFAALAAAIYINHKKTGIVFGSIAFLIGVTRVISGVHFPIDIIVGWILGFGLVSLLHRYMHITQKKES
jgi:undecaprenyl-diphosphatase